MKEQIGITSDGQGMSHFGNYDLVHRIAVGGMGEVYLARQRTAFGREVALKIIRSDLVHDITARKRFLREAEVSAYLKHEHILSMLEFGEEQGRLFIVTPYIKGGTLAMRLSNGPLTLAEVQELFSALVQAVAYLHRRGVVHRDLKPSNIMLDQEEGSERVYVRLIDFGIATIRGGVDNTPLTTAGNEMGTLAYMAPERANGVAAPSNDIYSLGVILYQMLTGQLPLTGPQVQLPPALADVVSGSINPDPVKRYSRAEELLKAFSSACNALRSLPQNSFATAPVDAAVPGASPIEASPVLRDLSPVAPLSGPLPDSSMPGNASLVRSLPARPEAAVKAASPARGPVFSAEDYNAPTAYIDRDLDNKPFFGEVSGPKKLRGKQLADLAIIDPAALSRPKKRRRSLVLVVAAAIVALLLAIGGLSALAFESSITANVSVTPQVQAVSNVFTITGKPGQNAIDLNNSTVPIGVLSSTQQASQQGPTTGIANCDFGVFNCKRAVSNFDVDRLSSQLSPTVNNQITQDLQNRLRAMGAIQATNILSMNPTITENPPINSPGMTVTVTYSQQGNVEYVRLQDAHSLAQQLLQRQLKAQYTLLSQSMQFSQPVIENVTPDGMVTLEIAAGGVGRYQVSASDIQGIQTHIKGLSQQNAQAYLAGLPYLNAKTSTLAISYGNTVPSNVQQIKVTSASPLNLPTVQLPAVPGATANQ